MSRIRPFSYIVTLFLALSFMPALYAQVPPSQTAGGVQGREVQVEKQKAVEEKIEKKKKKPEVEEKISPEAALPEGQKVLIKKISIEGVKLLTDKEIAKIIAPFEGKELTLDRLAAFMDKSSALRLEKIKQALTQLAGSLHKINQGNELLIQRHLGYINDIIKIFVTFGKKKSHYRKSGSLECEHRNLYDHRA